jgi:hypothetical protein
MKEFEFTLKFAFANPSLDPSDFVEALGAAGCDDALIGVGVKGRIAFDFCREAETAFDAIASAIADIRGVIPDARLIEATPDLVGMTDIAEVFGVTRQAVRKMVRVSIASFPAPAHEGNPALWHLAPVLSWAKANHRNVKPELLEVSRAAMQVNLVKECAAIEPEAQRRISALLA